MADSYTPVPLRPIQSIQALFARRDLTPCEKLECLKFYLTAYGHRSLFATLPRSGLNYTQLMVEVAWDIAQGGTGEYYYRNNKFFLVANVRLARTALDYRTPISLRRGFDFHPLQKPVIYSTHDPYDRIQNLQRSQMHVVVLVRNMFQQLESWLFHSGYAVETQADFIRDGFVDRSIHFYNSWGHFLERHPNSQLLKYEDLRGHPEQALRLLSRSWNLHFPEPAIEAAVAKCTKQEMLKVINQQQRGQNPRVSDRDAQLAVFTVETLKRIQEQIHQHLKYSFGYDYSTLPTVPRLGGEAL
ncbi:hypothetical protein DO97_10980 [Neosynechococcus sphagnicola sy1]|uniref:Sulfotransferase domain-containing protein n=1 Tax=Neosynechococcus sphagnicola sy1 TaxID=1497020 RepID=A0A098TJF2_9CYAN|nr:sulfotransferase domain-containing protein [Neosynechococcus sphagnicola]KGF72266.1 hypothetical protein DO97_10980 [Neosynechococcus sphagnicola sy1]